MRPRISVFITSYNQKNYLIQAIDSVIQQTLKPFEIIITDDNSTDGSQEVIARYARECPGLIRPFYHTNNMGIAKNKSFAQRQARGDWITYLDGDDRYLPEKLELEWKVLRACPVYKIVYSNFYRIDVKGCIIDIWADSGDPPSGYVFTQVFSRQFPRRILFRNEMIASDCLKEVGYYDESLSCYEDWDLKIRLSKKFPIGYSQHALVEYRQNPEGISLKSDQVFLLRQMITVYQKNIKLLKDVDSKAKKKAKRGIRLYFKNKIEKIICNTVDSNEKQKAIKFIIEFLKWMNVGGIKKCLLYCLKN